jgi:hypothetical protein
MPLRKDREGLLLHRTEILGNRVLFAIRSRHVRAGNED